jgi:hypothetical protein
MPPGELAHRLHRHTAQATALEPSRDRGDQRAQHGRLRLLESARNRPVDPRRKIFGRTIPANWNRLASSEDLTLLVDQMELEVGPLVV